MIIGTTGPSVFNDEIKSLVQDYYKATPLYINQDGKENLEWVLDNIGALILAGGRDIYPLNYGQEISSHNSLTNFDKPRDERELYLIKRCLELDIPILGICRGHQILAIAHGLHDYFMPDIFGSSICHNPHSIKSLDLDGLPSHFLYCLKNYHNEFFDKRAVNSFHHQAVYFSDKHLEDYKEKGIEVIGYSYLNYKEGNKAEQKIIELMRGVNKRWISTQWHPECDTDYFPNKLVLDKFKEMFPK